MFEAAYDRFQRELFVFVADCTGDENGSGTFPGWLVVLQEIVLVLQYLHFAFYRHIDFQWNDSVANVFWYIFGAVGKFPSPDTNRLIELYIAYAVPAGYAVLIAVAYICHTKLKWPYLLPILSYMLLLAPGILFIPVISAHAKLFFGCFAYSASHSVPNPFYPTMTCWSGEHIGASVASVITMALWMATSYVVLMGWANYDIPTDLNSRDYTATSTRAVEQRDRFVMWILIALFAGIHNTTGRYPLSILMLLAGATIVYMNIRYLPYYEDLMLMLVVFRGLCLAFSGFAAFLATLIGTRADSTIVLLYASLPVLVVVAVLLVRSRYATIESFSNTDLTEPHLFELRTRAILRRWMDAERNDAASGYLEETPERAARRHEIQQAMENLLKDGAARFPKSARLNIWMGLFYVCVYDNGVLGYGALQAASANDPSFDMRFLLYMYKRSLDAKITTTQSDEVKSYLEFKSRKALAEAAVADAAKRLVDFWTHLLRSSPDVELLANQGHLARQAMALATSHFEKLLTINPNSVPVLRAYGTFALDILGDVSKSRMLFERAEEVERNRGNSVIEGNKREKGGFLQVLDTNLDIFDDRNGVIGITVERESLGIMESVTTSARRILGYSQMSDLIGKNVSIACPSPMDIHHDRFLTEFIVRKTGRIINQTRMTFACHRAGHIVPINLYVRWSDAANGKILGVLQEVPLIDEVHLMVDPKTSVVTYVTSNCFTVFGLLRRQLMAREIRIQDILPGLYDAQDSDKTERNWEQFESRDGIEIDAIHMIKRSAIRTHAWAVRVSVHEDEVIFVRMLLLNDDEDAARGSDEESFDSDAEGISGGEDDDANSEAAGSKRMTAAERLQKHRVESTQIQSKATPKTLLEGPGSETAEEAVARRRKKKSANAPENQIVSVEKESTIGGSSKGGTANRAYNHKRLSKAIHNVNKWTSKRLERMTYSLGAVVLVLFAAALTYHLITDKYVSSISQRLKMSYLSGARAFETIKAAMMVRTLSMMSADSVSSIIVGQTGDDRVVVGVSLIKNLIDQSLGYIHDAMIEVDELTELSSMNKMSKDREEMMLRNSLDLRWTLGGIEQTNRVGLQELAVRFNGAALRVAHGATRNLARLPDTFAPPFINPSMPVVPVNEGMDTNLQDWDSPMGHYLVCANGFVGIPDAYLKDAQLIVEELHGTIDAIPIIGIIILVVSLALNIVILFLFIRPSIIMIKESKAQVLTMFLDIPKNIRRMIRHRVYGVYQMMRVEEDGADVAVHESGLDDELRADANDRGTELMADLVARGLNQSSDVETSQPRGSKTFQTVGSGSEVEMTSLSRKPGVNLDSLTAAARKDARRITKSEDGRTADMSSDMGGSAIDGVSGKSKAVLEKEMAKAHAHEAKTLESDCSWARLLLKFGFVLAIFVAYFVVLIVTLKQRGEQSREIAEVASMSLRRNVLILRSFSALREHLYGNHNYSSANNEIYPTLTMGYFPDVARESLNEMLDLHHAVIFGSEKYGIDPPPADPLQQSLLFDNACAIEFINDDATKYMYSSVYPGFNAQCVASVDGLFTRGLHAGLLQFELVTLNVLDGDYEAILAPLTGQVGHPTHAPNSPQGQEALQMFTTLDTIYNMASYIVPRSSALYYLQADNFLSDQKMFRVGFTIGFAAFLLLCYFLLFLPTIRNLNTDARNTRAMMLVLPPNIVKSIPSVQVFIMENFQRRD